MRSDSQSIPPVMQAATDHHLELLDLQRRDYATMYRISVKQRAHIAEEDVDGLQSSGRQILEIIECIRLRQNKIRPLSSPLSTVADPEVTKRNQAIGDLIRKLEMVRKENEDSVRRLLCGTRSELRKFQQGRQAVKGYRSQKVVEARFYDGKR